MPDGEPVLLSVAEAMANDQIIVPVGNGNWAATEYIESQYKTIVRPKIMPNDQFELLFASAGSSGPALPPPPLPPPGSPAPATPTGQPGTPLFTPPSSPLGAFAKKQARLGKKTAGQPVRIHRSDTFKAQVVDDLIELRQKYRYNEVDSYEHVAQKWKVPHGNVGRWYRDRIKIYKAAGNVCYPLNTRKQINMFLIF